MLAKSVTPGVREWDERLPFVLFAYQATLQVSVGESAFFLLYGRDPQLPTELVLCPPTGRQAVGLDDYKSVMMLEMGSAWAQAQKAVKKAQKRQKCQHDRTSKNADFQVGDLVFVCMPASKTGHMRKLARPFQGPYRVIATYANVVEVRQTGNPRAQAIRVALN